MNNSLELLFTEAQIKEGQGDWPGAINLYRTALLQNPGFLEAHHNLAVALRQVGEIQQALVSAQSAAKLAPDHPTVQFSLGVSLEQAEQADAAIEAYQKSADLRPNYIAALSNLGRLLVVQGRILDSIKILERALALAPSSNAVRLNLANSYLLGGKPENSSELLHRLIKDDPEISEISHSLACNSLGVAAHVVANRMTAISHFREAIELAPDFAEAHENLAQALLFEEEYEEGWREYEWRWLNQSNAQSRHNFETPAWQGDALKDQTLLVHAEQGFGDVIQFARFIPLINKANGRVIFACHPALIDLFSELENVDAVVDIYQEIADFDTHVPLLSLPRVLGIEGSNIPKALNLASNTVQKNKNSRPFKVGIAWAGMPRHEFDPNRNRSCPVDLFKPLLDIPNLTIYSLQIGPQTIDLERINMSGAIKDLSPQIESFRDTAELISELDLVITVDTALAHLAGSLDKKVWILLATCADWRWQDETRENPWYSSARLFRQKTPGNWSEPLDDVISEIQHLIP